MPVSILLFPVILAVISVSPIPMSKSKSLIFPDAIFNFPAPVSIFASFVTIFSIFVSPAPRFSFNFSVINSSIFTEPAPVFITVLSISIPLGMYITNSAESFSKNQLLFSSIFKVSPF